MKFVVTVFSLVFSAQAMGQVLPVCERTQQVQDFIVERINAVQGTEKTCADITRDDLASLERISVGHRQVESLQVGDFSGLPRLKILNLNGYLGAEFPEGLFSGLANLETLVIINAEIEQYPADFLVDTPRLKQCHCFQNPLTHIETPVIDRLAALEDLEILDFDATLDADVQEQLRLVFPEDGQVNLTFY